MADEMKKIPFEPKAMKTTATKAEMEEFAVYGDKGIPIQTPDGTKIFIITINNNGELVTTEVTE